MRKSLKGKSVKLSSEYCNKGDVSIYTQVISLLQYKDAKCVFCYVSKEPEVSTTKILEDILAKGKILAVPKCISKGIMVACEVQDIKQLTKDKFGIFEPKDCKIVRPDDIDMAIIPCLSASKDGNRLGYGGGYYDRYLVGSDFVKVALCYEKMLECSIPVDNHDVKMDMLITEEKVMNFANGGLYEKRF